MGVTEQTSHCSSNKPTFSQITQTLPEIWSKRWTEYSCCYDNVMIIQNHTIKNKDAPDFREAPDQLSRGHSNKATLSQITQAVPEI